MDKQLLDILVCPVSGLSLSLADDQTIDTLNAEIDAGRATQADERVLTTAVTALLVTRDGATGYRVEDGIPVMLPECGIPLTANA